MILIPESGCPVVKSQDHLGNAGLPKGAAEGLAADMDRGVTIAARIKDLTGGTRDKPTRGANLEISIYRD